MAGMSEVLLIITAWLPKIAGVKWRTSYSQMSHHLINRERHIQNMIQPNEGINFLQGEPLHGLERDPKTVLGYD